MGCGCQGGNDMKQYNADTDDAFVSNPVCDSSPDTYARQRRLNSSLMAGGLFGVGSLLYFFATRKMNGISNTLLTSAGIGSAALLGNYTVLGNSTMDSARTEYAELCPDYTGGGNTGEQEVDNADEQP